MKNELGKLLLFALGIALIAAAENKQIGPHCNFNYDDELPANLPVIIRKYNREILYPRTPDLGQNLRFKHTGRYIASCPESVFQEQNKTQIKLICRKKRLRQHGKIISKIEELDCEKMPSPQVLWTSETCGTDAKIYRVAYVINEKINITSFTACFKRGLHSTTYADYLLRGRLIDNRYKGDLRSYFTPGGVFVVSMKDAYVRKNQYALMRKILGRKKGPKIIPRYSGSILVSGFLAPDRDFMFEYEQDGAYNFVNTVPIWKTIDDGNWKDMAEKIRAYAAEKDAWLEIRTGSCEILKLLNDGNNPAKLYLYKKRNDHFIPVPKLLWKIVYYPKESLAIAFVVINDPFESTVADTINLCTNICYMIPWVDWDITSFEKGFTLCCTIESLRAANISSIPTKLDRDVGILA